MKRAIVAAAALGVLHGCGPSADTGKPPLSESKEAVFQRGHRLYQTMQWDQAEAELKKAMAMDSGYVDPVIDLASLYYDLGKREEGEKDPRRLDRFRSSWTMFARAEALGYRDATAYDRLCELSLALEDSRGFLTYARKNAASYPFDRQYYNLGLAYFAVEDWQGVVKSQREAAEKFRQSPYIGGFYRQMARAYMKMDRDQTAERTLTAGLQAADGRIAALKRSGGDYRSTEEFRRLVDDRVGMLLLLKRLHTIYKEADKLEQDERQLKEAGSTQ